MGILSVPWSEECKTRQQASQSWSPDSASVTYTIRIGESVGGTSEDVYQAIPQIVGSSTVVQQSGSTPMLSRLTPWTHPLYPWLRATKILSINGEGPKSRATTDSGYGSYGDAWRDYVISVLFEVPSFPIQEDDAIDAEYQRYTTIKWDDNLETLARKGVQWTFFGGATGPFAGDAYLRTPKGILHLLWHDVPSAFVEASGFYPTNFRNCIGKLNLYPFPNFPFPSSNGTKVKQFAPGTLLCLPIKSNPRAQVNAALFDFDNPPADYFFRTLDCEIMLVEFDPPTPGTATVYVPTYQETISILGHNTLPTPMPVGNYAFYPATNGPVPTGVLSSDLFLQYQYADFETIFEGLT